MEKLPFEMDYLTDEIVDLAEKELGETEEIRKKALMELRMAIKEEQKLFCPMSDHYLLQFLRSRKFQVKRTFGLLQNYYHVKKGNPDIYGKSNFDGFKQTLTERIINVMPYRDYDGAVIMVLQLYRWNVNEMKFSTFVHSITSSLILLVDSHPATQICGIKLVIDAKNMGLSYARHVSPRLLHLIGRGLVNCLPVRFKEIHFINHGYAIQYFWSVARLVLSEKIKNRMIFHNDTESLHKRISPELLPEEYDGYLEYDNRFWVKKIDQGEDRYIELLKYGYKTKKDNQDEVEN